MEATRQVGTENTRVAVERSATSFTGMVGNFSATADELLVIAAAMHQLEETNRGILGHAQEIDGLSQYLGERMRVSLACSNSLNVTTEILWRPAPGSNWKAANSRAL